MPMIAHKYFCGVGALGRLFNGHIRVLYAKRMQKKMGIVIAKIKLE